ncbi:MAG: bifunctional oligoribonuclease/PAP phosphatase NrnA [Clostridiales bacterium]|nr:bifunctional oligoribonuclease/PAP phosphatase NrnA [Clostridiales bacterium]
MSPDGDTLGSGLALLRALRRMGKAAHMVCPDRVPRAYLFLAGADEVKKPDDAPEFENIIFVDCGDLQRAGAAGRLFESAAHSLCIDHHSTNEGYCEINWIEGESASTGELVYLLLQDLDIPLDAETAACLYAAIATDTGNFAFAAVTSDTFRTAAALLDAGLDLADCHRRLFQTNSLTKTRLLRQTLQNMELFAEDRAALSSLTRDELKRFNATWDDCEGLIDPLRMIEGVEIACTLREMMSSEVRVSLRSKDYANVAAIAMRFGGGGHEKAAGCTLACPMQKAKDMLKRAMLEELRKCTK